VRVVVRLTVLHAICGRIAKADDKLAGLAVACAGGVLLDDITLTIVVPVDDTLGDLTTRIGIRGTSEWIFVAVLASTWITTARL